jgi:hypothetical protein
VRAVELSAARLPQRESLRPDSEAGLFVLFAADLLGLLALERRLFFCTLSSGALEKADMSRLLTCEDTRDTSLRLTDTFTAPSSAATLPSSSAWPAATGVPSTVEMLFIRSMVLTLEVDSAPRDARLAWLRSRLPCEASRPASRDPISI